MSDTDDIENLFKNNYDALCMYSRHYVEDIYTAEDIVMDCFLKLSEKIEHGDQILAKEQLERTDTCRPAVPSLLLMTRLNKTSGQVSYLTECLSTR